MKENGVPRVKYILVTVFLRVREDERLEQVSYLSQATLRRVFGTFVSELI